MTKYEKKMEQSINDSYKQQDDIFSSDAFQMSGRAAQRARLTAVGDSLRTGRQMQAGLMGMGAMNGQTIDNESNRAEIANAASQNAVDAAADQKLAQQMRAQNIASMHGARQELYKWMQERDDAMKSQLISSATQLASSAMSSFSPMKG